MCGLYFNFRFKVSKKIYVLQMFAGKIMEVYVNIFR